MQVIIIDWMNILKQAIEGCVYLHNNYKTIHNDIKCDNIVLTSGSVIVDFGKPCKIDEGKIL